MPSRCGGDPVRLRSAAWRVPALAAATFVHCRRRRSRSPSLTSAVARGRARRSTCSRGSRGSSHLGDEGGHLPLAIGLLGLAALGTAAWLVFRPLAAPRALPDPEVRHAVERDRAAPRPRHAGVLQAARRPAVPVQRRRIRVPRLPRRGRRDALRRRPGRPESRRAGSAREDGDVRRSCGASGSAPSRSAPPPLPPSSASGCGASTSATRRSSRPGGSRSRAGRSARCASPSPGSRRPASRSRWRRFRRSARRRWPSSSASPMRGGRAPTSAVSRWRWSGSVTLSSTRRSSRSPATTRGTCAASSTSCRPTGGRRCRSRSCAATRRRPNGLTEFLVARSIEALRARGVEEVSLNFAAFARLLTEPENLLERARGAGAALGRRVVPDREPVPVQREVRSALGAALRPLRGPARARPGGARRSLGRGADCRSRWPAGEPALPPRRPAFVVAAFGSAWSCSPRWPCSSPPGRSISPSSCRASMSLPTGTSSGSASTSGLPRLRPQR